MIQVIEFLSPTMDIHYPSHDLCWEIIVIDVWAFHFFSILTVEWLGFLDW